MSKERDEKGSHEIRSERRQAVKRWVAVCMCLAFAAAALVVANSPSTATDGDVVVVGRVYHVEGELLRYVPEERNWVPVVKDAPFGNEDALFSGNRSAAELIVPNGSRIRIGESTQIQCIDLGQDLTETDVATGLARFYNNGTGTLVKATSPFGYVLAYPGAVFDFYVGDNSVEVVAVQGRVTFVHTASQLRYDVSAGFPSILADENRVSRGDGTVDPDWDRWNKDRDIYWAAKARVRGRSADYLPPALREESYALDENGTWEMVPYEGANRWFWRPTRVVAGWSPFTVGRWTYWYGDQCWIPAEPFGYITHHYGNWVYARNQWYWAPPVAVVRVGLPLLDIGFFWYPGRVVWIHSGPYVGWIPLAPREPYYCHRHWGGPYTVVVSRANVAQININLRNYAHAHRAVVVNEHHFHGVRDYRNVRVTNVQTTTILNNYRPAPVINNTVIKQYTTIKERYNYTNAPIREKPHHAVISRIEQNERIARQDARRNAAVLQEYVKRLPEGRPDHESRIETPKSANYVVPAAEANRQKSDMKFQQKEIKRSAGERPKTQPAERSERAAPARLGEQRGGPPQPPQSPQPQTPKQVRPEGAASPQPKQSEVREQVKPQRPVEQKTSRPAQPMQPSALPERVTPARPATAAQPVTPRPTQPQQPQTQKQITIDGPLPAQPQSPVAKPKRVAPANPGDQPGRTGQPPEARPERVSPSPSSGQPERAQPKQPEAKEEAKPRGRAEQTAETIQLNQPGARPDRVTPARPVQQDRFQSAPAQQRLEIR